MEGEESKTEEFATQAPSGRPHSIARLDIGGTRFTTTVETLQRYPHCVLARKEIVEACKAGKVPFIDRDPTFFPYVLNFLRDPVVENFVPPPTADERRRFYAEAHYYGLADAVSLCRSIYRDDIGDGGDKLAKYVYLSFERVLTLNEETVVSAMYLVNGKEVRRDAAGWFKKGVNLAEVESIFRHEVSKVLDEYDKRGYELGDFTSAVANSPSHSTTKGDKRTNDVVQTLVLSIVMKRTSLP